jgi:cytochrome c-type biogenesis protein CcmH/NrfG
MARRGRWGEAAELLRLTPPSPDNDEWLAYLMFQDGQYREAYSIYSGMAESTGSTEMHLNTGVALALLGNDAAAMQVYDGILEDDPQHLRARLYLANAQLRTGRIETAAINYRAYLDSGGSREAAERVRRILKQIAPELAPDAGEPVVPALRPASPRDGPEPEVGS